MAAYVILDTETTGASEEDRIIQLGFLVLEAKKPVEVVQSYCLAEVPVKIEAMEVHNITPEMLEGAPACVESDAYQRLQALNSKENYLIIHNAPFDMKMLEKEGFVSQMQLIDTLRCAKHLFEDSPYHRLQYFRYAMKLYQEEEQEAQKLNIEVKAHDAIGDVLVLKLFLSKLKEACEEQFVYTPPVQKLVELTQEPVFVTRAIRFGKHKGKTVTEIAAEDSRYLKWMLESMENLDEDLRYTIERVLHGENSTLS